MLAFALMAVGLTRADVEAIAQLARLHLSEDELDLFARQLAEILEYANQVQRIDTTGVAPTASVLDLDAGCDRPDIARPSLDRTDTLANAPDAAVATGLFKVPRVIG